MEPLFLTPYFRPKTRGGRKLNTILGHDTPDGKAGEIWVIFGYRDDVSTANVGLLKGKTLREVYLEHPELFGNPKVEELPLSVKFLDANDNLSVQVHPDDEYARIYENDSGKTESWYVLHAELDAKPVYGHNATSKEELEDWIKNGKWSRLLRYAPVKEGDFLYAPSGTTHVLTRGIMAIETQQSSDVTYRLYDWDQVDKKTDKKRELYIKQSLDTIQVPHKGPKLKATSEALRDVKTTTSTQSPMSPHFYLWQIDVDGSFDWSLNGHPYLLVSVIRGKGKFIVDGKEYSTKLGTNFITPNEMRNFSFSGDLRLVISAPGKE